MDFVLGLSSSLVEDGREAGLGDPVGVDSMGGAVVPDLEEKKKNELIPGDEPHASSCQKATPRVDQSRKIPGVRIWEGIELIIDEEIFSSNRRTLRSDVAAKRKRETEECQEEIRDQKKRRILQLDVAKKREEADTCANNLAEEAVTCANNLAEEAVLSAGQDESSSVISKTNGTELIICVEETTDYENNGVLCLDISEKVQEVETSGKKDSDINEKKGNVKDAPPKKKAKVTLGEIEENDCDIRDVNDTEQMTFESLIETGTKRITRSDAARQREEARLSGTDKGSVNAEAALEAGHQGNNLVSKKMNDNEKLKNVEDIFENKIMCLDVTNQMEEANAKDTVEKMTVTRSHAGKKRKRAHTTKMKDKDKPDNDMKNAIEEATPEDGQNEDLFAISNKDNVELIKCEEDRKIEKKRITRSVVVKQREEAETAQTKVAESVRGTKRSISASDVETTAKKLKSGSLSLRQDQTRHKDCPSDEKMKPDKKKTSKLDCAKDRWIKCSGQRTATKFISNIAYRGGIRKDNFGITYHTSSRSLGRGGVPEFDKGHIRRDAEENRKCLLPSIVACTSVSKSLDEEGESHNILCSSVSLGKSWLRTDEESSTAKKTSHDAENGSELNNMDPSNSNDKNEVLVKGESSSMSKALLPSKQSKGAARIGRRTIKQKLRDQIKEMLVNSGWKIDLRPRAGKNYNDSVYMSPHGSSYWSITKAYHVFQSQMNCSRVVSGKHMRVKYSKKLKGRDCKLEETSYPSSSVSEEALSILKKVIGNRRTKKELEEAKEKLEDGNKSKKANGTTGISHRKKRHLKYNRREIMERKKKSNIASTSGKGNAVYTPKKQHKGKNGEKQRGNALLVRSSNQETETVTDVPASSLWRRTIFSWMIDSGIMPSNCRVKYMNQDRTQAMLQGWITRNGVHCSCCSKILTVSNFEIHAGGKLCQPYQSIYLEESGISLLQCQLNAWEKQDESARQSFCAIDIDGDDPNDDTCGICGDGGDLICCDGCPSTFHLSCLGIQMLPPGNWHCTNCSCKFCGQVSCSDLEENGLTVFKLLTCSQCEEKYHPKCIPDGDVIPSCPSLPCLSFCGQSCKKLFEQLQGFLCVKNDLGNGFSWTLLQRFDEDLPESIRGLDQKVECNSKVAVALEVMNECFLPISDQRSSIDLIHNVVYNCGSNFSRLNYRGFYTFILERDDEVISAASVRIHGTRLAEMPFIGTRHIYRRQGMCRRLLSGIESALSYLNIEKLLIPAISELRDTWTNVFGFKPLEISQKQQIRSINLLVFPGTGLLLKPLLKAESTENCKTVDGGGYVDKIETCSKYYHKPGIESKYTVCSLVGLGPDDSAEVFGRCEHEVKDSESDFKVSTEGVDASHGSESPAFEYKSSDVAANEDLLLHPDLVYHEEPLADKKFQADSVPETEVKLFGEVNVQSNGNVKTEGVCVERNLLVAEHNLPHHTSDSRYTSPDCCASALQDSGVGTAPINGTLSPNHYNLQYTSLDTVPSSQHESGANEMHIPDSSLELSFDETNHCTSEASGKFSVPFPIGIELQRRNEHNVVHDSNRKHQVGILQPNSSKDVGNVNSEIIVGTLDAKANTFLKCSVEPSIQAASEHTVHELEEQFAAMRLEPFVDDGNSAQCGSDIIKTPADVGPGKERKDFCMISASHDTDITSSYYKYFYETPPVQHNSQLRRNLTGSPCDVILSSSTNKLHCGGHNLVNSLNTTPLAEPVGACDSHEINEGATHIELQLSALGESSVKYQATRMVNSLAVTSESISSNAVYVPKPDEVNHSLHMVAKPRDPLAPTITNFCASTQGIMTYNHNVRFEDGQGVASRLVTSEVAEDHPNESISGFDGVVLDDSNLTSGVFLNKVSNSTEVQHALAMTNETSVAVTVTVEPSHAC